MGETHVTIIVYDDAPAPPGRIRNPIGDAVVLPGQAERIVAMTPLPDRVEAIRTSTDTLLLEMGKRIDALESKMNDVLPNLTPAEPAYDGLAVRQMLDDERANMQSAMCGTADQPARDDAAVDHVSLGNAIICPSCDGRGEDCDEEGPTNQDCPRCHGHAWFYRHEYVADLRAKLAEAQRVCDLNLDAAERCAGERDKALAELAAEREKRETAVAACAMEKERAEKAERGLAAVDHARLFALEGKLRIAEREAKEWEQAACDYNDVVKQRDAARAEAAQWKDRAEKAEGYVDGLEVQVKVAHEKWDELAEERDAARAEADALRADAWDTMRAIGIALGLPEPPPVEGTEPLQPEWNGKLSEKAAALRAERDALKALVPGAINRWRNEWPHTALWMAKSPEAAPIRELAKAAGVPGAAGVEVES